MFETVLKIYVILRRKKTTIIHVVADAKLQQSEYYKMQNTTTHRVTQEIYILVLSIHKN